MSNEGRGGGRGFRGGGFTNSNRVPWKMMYARSRGRSGGRRGSRGQGRGRGNENTDNDNERFNFNVNGSGGQVSPENRSNDSEHNSNHRSREDFPPVSLAPVKRKRCKTIKGNVIAAWKKIFPGYCLYYPDAPPQLSEVENKILLITDYLRRKCFLIEGSLMAIESKEYFEVICEQVLNDSLTMNGWPEFLEDLSDDPAEVVNLWSAVMHKIICESAKSEDEDVVDQNSSTSRNREALLKANGNVGRIQAGIMKLEPVVPLIRINSSLLGKFVTVRGIIASTGSVQAICIQLTFLCKICESPFIVDQPYGLYTLPKKCGASDECDNKNYFEPYETAETTLMMDCRKIRLQDIQNYDLERGSVPKTIDCELKNSLVYQCNTGDAVTITGIVKWKKEFHFHGEQSLHNLYIEVVAMKNHNDSDRTMGGHWFSFGDRDYCAIVAIHDTPNIFRLLTASLCPSIYGHDLVKAAIILSLFGGASHQDEMLSRRSDINILMVGDPGIGKSQILKIVTEVAPRGVYVCGTGSTVAGLTVTLVRDGDEYSLEAGALVMADRGVCCIDEFDKMLPQHPALLEAMEQQSVSIAKSGVFRTLPARTTVIAAANPVGGHYDKRKSVIENIKINSALLSRFDITFILLDKPNKDFDQRIVEHIMGVAGSKKVSSSGYDNFPEFTNIFPGIPLIERLKVPAGDSLDLIPHALMRKYIAYARQYVRPKISPDAAEILKEYYMHLRVKHRMRDSTPITTRQLESLMRLTEARAKVELRETATAEDAKDILEIFESSLSSAFDDEVVAVSALSQSILIGPPTGTGKSGTRNEAKRLVAALQKSAEQQCKNIFTIDEIKQRSNILGLRSPVDSLIAILNNDGFLLKKGAKTYQLQTASY